MLGYKKSCHRVSSISVKSKIRLTMEKKLNDKGLQLVHHLDHLLTLQIQYQRMKINEAPARYMLRKLLVQVEFIPKKDIRPKHPLSDPKNNHTINTSQLDSALNLDHLRA